MFYLKEQERDHIIRVVINVIQFCMSFSFVILKFVPCEYNLVLVFLLVCNELQVTVYKLIYLVCPVLSQSLLILLKS